MVSKKYPTAKILAETFSKKVLAKCRDAEILCGMVHSDFSRTNLEKLPKLKLVVTRTAGHDHLDLKYLAERKIPAAFVPEYGSHAIAEHVFALLLASCRNVLEGETRTNHDNFSWCGLKGLALKNKTIGIIGTGRIGGQVCRIASDGFLMKVLGVDTHKNPELKKLKDEGIIEIDNRTIEIKK